MLTIHSLPSIRSLPSIQSGLASPMFKLVIRSASAVLLSLGLAGAGQGSDNDAYIREVTPEVRELVANVEEYERDPVELSQLVQDVVAHNEGLMLQKPETDAADGEQERFVLSATSDTLFGSDGKTLSEGGQAILGHLAELLSELPEVLVDVMGYTDSTGTKEQNQEVSDARAEAVTSYLVDNGINGARILSKGLGESQPVAPNEIDGNDNPEGRAKNRRVEIILSSPRKEEPQEKVQ